MKGVGMSRGKRRVLVLLGVSGLALAVAAGIAVGQGPNTSGLKKGTFKVGYGNNLSGFLAVHDHLISNGAKVAVAQINAKGGVGGKVKLKLNLKDVKSDTAESVKVANEIIAEKDQVMMLPCNTDFQVAMAATAKRSGTFMLSPCNADPTLGSKFSHYWGVGMAGNAQGAQLASYVKKLGKKRAYVVDAQAQLYVQTMAKYFRKAAPSRQIRIVGSTKVPVPGDDYSSAVTKIKNTTPKPDVIMTGIFNPFLGTLLKNLRAQGVKTPVVGTDGAESAPILALSAATTNGTAFTTFGYPTPGSATAKFYAQYKKRFGSRPDGSFAALGYEAVKVLEAAMLKANSTDPAKIEAALSKGLTVNGALGPIKYAGHGRHNPSTIVVVDRIKNKHFALALKSVPKNVPRP
jgi:branched-chain amino acid transport system substrate-binding protein